MVYVVKFFNNKSPLYFDAFALYSRFSLKNQKINGAKDRIPQINSTRRAASVLIKNAKLTLVP